MAPPPKYPLMYPEADRLVRSACADRGISMSAACELAGVTQDTLRNWVLGRYRPKQADVGSLAKVLDLPQLLDEEVLGFRSVLVGTAPYMLRCPYCKKERTVSPRKTKFSRTAQLDPVTRTGTWPCQRCASSAFQNNRWSARKPRRRQKAEQKLEEARGRLQDSPNKFNGVQAMHRRVAEHGYTVDMGQKVIEARMARPFGRFGICRVCRYLAYRNPGRGDPQWHQKCFLEWKKGRSCVVVWEKGTDAAMGSRPPSLKGQVPSAEKLAAMWELTVRHLVEGEPIVRKKKDPAKRKVKQQEGEGESTKKEEKPGLAEEFGLTPQGARKWVRDVLALLPPDERGSEKLQRWTATLRRYAEESPWRSRP